MPTVSSMALLYSLEKDNQSEMQHDFSGPKIPLASALHDGHCTSSCTIAFLRSGQLK